MSVQVEKQLFTVEDYYKMAEAGILKSDDRVELISGEILKISPIRSPHSSTVNFLNEILISLFYKKAIISVQNPLRINKFSESEPDFVIAKWRIDRYRLRHPRPNDVYLVIEVSDSTLAKDRSVKLPLYASANIPEYWIVNIPEEQIEIYRKPNGKTYEEQEVINKKGRAICQSIAFEVDVNEVL